MIKKPTLTAAMTPFPHSVQIDSPIAQATKLMAQHRIHHLPVADGGAIVGIITFRDTAEPPSPSAVVGDGHTPDPYLVDLATPLDEVLFHMAESQIGHTVVTHHGRLAGIFTVVDACRTFAAHLRALYRVPSEDSVA